MKRAWFKDRTWEYVVLVNAGLCRSGNALHQPTTDGYEQARAFWVEHCELELTLDEAVEICRRCHRLAPFCFYNGNTFAAIIRDCIAHAAGLDRSQIALAKSLAGHMVAGTAEPEEIRQFGQLLRDIDQGIPTHEILQSGSCRIGDRVQTPKGTRPGSLSKSMPIGRSLGNVIRPVL
ncbi:MAG: hypothetical protein LV479_10850 [Methylacidiphilales bacterium]|nr:hypothetical protein [Candidatus Methylacidiphilales bacterium]